MAEYNLPMPKRRGKSRSMKIVGRATPMNYRGLDRRMVVDRLGLKCHWCGVFTDNSIYNEDSPRKTTIDHIYNRLDPRRRGNDDKVVVACEACNLMRARMHEYIFGARNFPIHYALEIEEEATSIEPIKLEPPKPILNPVIQGPRVVKDVPPLTRWQKLVAFVSLRVFKIKKTIKTYFKHQKFKRLFTRKG